MPNRWPIANGNWSNSAIWSGSLIPTASDDVFLNNQVVIVDQNITVASIRNAATSSAVANGRIEIYNNYVINCSSIRGTSTTTYLVFNYNTGSTTLNATLNISSSGLCVDNISTGTINVVGDVYSPNNVGFGNLYSVRNFSSGILNIIGNLLPIAGNNGDGNGTIHNLQNGTVNVTGNVQGGSAGGGGSIRTILNASIGQINITGNVIGSTIVGGSTSQTILNSSIGQLTITGNVTANVYPAITTTTAGIINVIGQLAASTASNAVSSTSTTATNVFSGPLINSGSRNAIYCYNVRLYDDVTTRYTIGVSGSTNTISLLSPDQVTGVPSGSNVRAGILFGPGNELTGSMNVPNQNSVAYGVPVDNTSGSALVNPEDLWNFALTSLTASNSIGQRLASTATSASNAAITSAF